MLLTVSLIMFEGRAEFLLGIAQKTYKPAQSTRSGGYPISGYLIMAGSGFTAPKVELRSPSRRNSAGV